MITIPSSTPNQFCSGRSRRDALKIGALAMGGLSLPQMLRAEAAAGVGSSTKSVIMVYLPGGPTHLDMWDIKEDAPSQIRGEFNAMATSVPGVRICEHLPNIAKNMEHFAPIRSISDSFGQHSNYQTLTGHSNRPTEPAGGWPELGAVLAKFQGDTPEGVPSTISMQGGRGATGGGFLGAAYQPFLPNGRGKADMQMQRGMTIDRLDDREALLSAFDNMKRSADNTGMMEGLDEFNQKAFDVVTSNKLMDALDINKAQKEDLDRYRSGVNTRYRGEVDKFLTARRLVEAGARCVTLSTGSWDTHSNNFTTLKDRNLPALDCGLANLVHDLKYSGMIDDVSIVVWGEFGRTPKVNTKAGRDHWPRVMGALLAGGGLNTGQIIGETDRGGAEASVRPVRVGEVFATLYKAAGLEPSKLNATDLSGRPLALVDPNDKPMRELI
ncbi:MAG: hypothetical protein ACI8UO_004528 [Verrucomicrobiales bacterium]|jgi:uncharacterized protein (DUF1501 family)